MQPGKGQSHLIDGILRRSQWRQRHQLHGEQDLAALRRRLKVPFERQGELFEDLEPTEKVGLAAVAPD